MIKSHELYLKSSFIFRNRSSSEREKRGTERSRESEIITTATHSTYCQSNTLFGTVSTTVGLSCNHPLLSKMNRRLLGRLVTGHWALKEDGWPLTLLTFKNTHTKRTCFTGERGWGFWAFLMLQHGPQCQS